MYNLTYSSDEYTALEGTLTDYRGAGNLTYPYTIKLIQISVQWDIPTSIEFKFKHCFGEKCHFPLQGGHRKEISS
jgi:hypothetical protein